MADLAAQVGVPDNPPRGFWQRYLRPKLPPPKYAKTHRQAKWFEKTSDLSLSGSFGDIHMLLQNCL